MELKKLYLKDIEREIQGVIKVDDDNYISQELEEYVVTEELLKYMGNFFDAYKKGIDGRTDKMGVWISGFFGSGKSHFLKILSYLLENRIVAGKPAVDYFDTKIKDKMLLADMKRSGNIACDVILFNIDSKASLDNNENKDKILSVFEKVFNEKLGLSTIPHVADLERYLIKHNKYDEFQSNFKKESNLEWKEYRNDFYFRRDEIVNAYSKTMNQSVESAENWFDKAEENYDISIEKFADRVKDYIISKGNDHHVVFLVDEIGQYIGDDTRLMLNLQTLVENLGIVCGGKAWVIVTSQQNIDEVVKVKGNDFSKIIGRFDTRLPLSSANVDEVIKKRILNKNESATDSLTMLYDSKESIIKNLLTFTKSAEQKNYVDNTDFSEIYPFIPYQFHLLQSVFTDIRKHGFAGKHLSEGERSLLGAFQETAKRYSNEEIGTLIPFYAFYDTIEQFLEHHVRIVIENAKSNKQLKEVDIKVLKLLFMLKNIKELPSTVDNIATLFVSKIDDDKLEIKDQVKESLRRLEIQTLIQRNNDEYIFLTDEEQEINREIKSIIIDSKNVTDFLKKIVFDKILMDIKFTYNNKYPFPIVKYLDGIKYSAQESEMGVRVVTTALDRGEMALITESMRESKYVYLKLNISTILMEEITNILQLDEYMKQKNGVNTTSQIDDILRAKRREADKTEGRIIDNINELLKEGDVYIGGDKQNVNSRTPMDRLREALNILVGRIYTKISYIETNFSEDDIKRAFREPMINLLGNELEKPNPKAYKAILDYCKEQSDRRYNVTIRSLLQDFERPPFGFLQNDILYVLTRLLKDEVVSLVYNNENQAITSEETLTKIINRAYYEKTIIKLRTRVNEKLILDLKNVSMKVFDNVGLRPDEDGMMQDFKEKNTRRLSSDLKLKLGNYNSNGHYNYPGKEIIESTIKLLDEISEIKDTTSFFELVSNEKEKLAEYVKNSKEVLSFFDGDQRKRFDEAKTILKIYEDNKDYTDENQKLKASAQEMTDVLTMEIPYSDIHKLPTLGKEIIEMMAETYDIQSKPMIAYVKNVIEYIENTLKANNMPSELGSNFIDVCKKRINDLECSKELKDIYATEKYINGIKDEFLRTIEIEKRKNSKSTEPVVQRKDVEIKNIMSRSYEINSKEDIDKYVDDLKNKLIKELETNRFLRIK